MLGVPAGAHRPAPSSGFSSRAEPRDPVHNVAAPSEGTDSIGTKENSVQDASWKAVEVSVEDN